MLEASGLLKDYGRLRILDGVDLRLGDGESAAIMGPSGSGKSTLLYLLGALDRPSAGSVRIDDIDVTKLTDTAQALFRNQRIGFVFQDHALLPQCSALENVLVPTLIAPRGPNYNERARRLLQAVGLGERLDHKPAQLSGGERQRAAIARALILEPRLVLCDEPTGNLDQDSAGTVADLLLNLHRETNSVLVAVTHSTEFAARFPARYELRHGRLETA